MPRYRVAITELVTYELYVEADNEEKAGKAGQEKINGSISCKDADSVDVHNQEIFVEEVNA